MGLFSDMMDELSARPTRQPEKRLERLMVALARSIKSDIHQLKEMTMSLAPQVQALLDAVAVQGAAITDATTELTKVETMVVDLQKQLTDLQAGAQPIDPEDLAAIAQATDAVNASVQTLKSAMPTPVAPTTVQDATAAAQAAQPGAA